LGAGSAAFDTVVIDPAASDTGVVEGRQKRLRHDERRRRIIETTLTCLARHGAEGTTLRSVCREMGVAPSLITHFFEGWHDLLFAAYEMLSEQFIAHLAPILEHTFPSERARMDELIRSYLATDWAVENNVGANIALWQLSRTVVDLRGPFTRCLEGRTRVLSQALARLAAEAGASIDVNEITTCFILMLDGVWLELSLNPGNIAEQRARQLCWTWIDAVLGEGGVKEDQGSLPPGPPPRTSP
jgi:AcrR family transcriptional regulator